ncbi:MAG: D-aminoacyl-tRNA deacylase [Candidatus Thermoplasmatota archaeon]|nr:D-aminoacyl-tRNA deacylase [Candidatus Thermoplasmatota archaeon]
MVLLLVSSAIDEASMNIRRHLLSMDVWEECGQELWGSPVFGGHVAGQKAFLAMLPDEHIRHERFDEEASILGPEGIIVLSRHRSESGARSLTVHPIGNYLDNKFGGEAKTLVPSSPLLMTAALRELKKTGGGLDYDITYEVTHHGPKLSTPTFFIEIGSGEKEWEEEEPARAIAAALQNMRPNPEDKILVGIGGGHYAPRFAEIACGKKVAFGHMVPSYILEGLDAEGVEAALRLAVDSTPGASGFYMHKKGIKGEAKKLARAGAERIGLPLLVSSDLEEA